MAGNANFNRLISATLDNYSSRLEDNIFTSKPLLFALTNFGNVVTLDGGVNIVQPLMYAELGNQGSYSGSDTFLTAEDEGTTAASYAWKQYYAVIRLENIEAAKNSGSSAVLRLVENEVKRAELSISESLDIMFFKDGTGNNSKDWLGLDAFVSATTVVGGIDPAGAGNSWWKADVNAAGPTITDFTEVRQRYLAVSEGNDFPTNIMTDETLYAVMDKMFESNQRFTNPAMANQGFETIMFHQAPISFDRNCQAQRIYFLNLKYMTHYKLGSNWFKMSDWVEPINQDIRLKKIILYGELTISNRKRQAVMTGVS